MKEYIERAAVHELMKSLSKYQMFSYDRTEKMIGIDPDDVDFGVDKIPAADVAEVRHGYWEHVPGTLNTYSQLRCTVCGWWTLDPSVDGVYHYCPNCGCQMNKEA